MGSLQIRDLQTVTLPRPGCGWLAASEEVTPCQTAVGIVPPTVEAVGAGERDTAAPPHHLGYPRVLLGDEPTPPAESLPLHPYGRFIN